MVVLNGLSRLADSVKAKLRAKPIAPLDRPAAYRFTAIVVIAGLALAGCNSRSGIFLNAGQNVQGPAPVVDGDTMEKVDLVTELWGASVDWSGRDDTDGKDNVALALAYEAFYDRVSADTTKGKRLRNRIQGRIIQASNQACGVYINFLRQFETQGEFFLGSMATILAGAGAIVTGANAARALSGSAAIFEGTRAEFRQAFFSNLATHVIVPGIEHRRDTILNGERGNENESGILANWDEDLEKYPVEMAIADALHYHAHCNLMAGLVESADLIQLGKRPGIIGITNTLREMGENRTLVDILSGKVKPGEDAARDEVNEVLAAFEDLQDSVEATRKKANSARKTALAPFDAGAKKKLPDDLDKAVKGFDADIKKADARVDGAIAEQMKTASNIAKQVTEITKALSSAKTAGKDRKAKQEEILDQRARLRLAKRDQKSTAKNHADAVEKATKALNKVAGNTVEKLKSAAANSTQAAANAAAAAVKAAGEAEAEVKLVEASKSFAELDLRRLRVNTKDHDVTTAIAKAKKAMAAAAVAAGLLKGDGVIDKKSEAAVNAKIKAAAKKSKKMIARADAALVKYRKEFATKILPFVNRLDDKKKKDQQAINSLAKLVFKTVPKDAAKAKADLIARLKKTLTDKQMIALEKVRDKK